MTEKISKTFFGIANRVDYVALSFVQDPADVHQIKGMIKALGADVPVIAKIEKMPAIDMIDEIAQVADGRMDSARGDLELKPLSKEYLICKRRSSRSYSLWQACHNSHQMLESMINNPRASLAEVVDVANGVLDGAGIA